MSLHDNLTSAAPTPSGRLDGASIIRAADRRRARRRRVTLVLAATALAVPVSAALLNNSTNEPDSLVPPLAPASTAPPSPATSPGATVSPPGGPLVQELADPVVSEGTGTQRVELGRAPAGTTSIEFGLTCLTAGTFKLADGSSITCQQADVGSPASTGRLQASDTTTATQVTAAVGQRWRLTATYSAVTTSEWGRNGAGLTYGVQNERGTPDLVAVVASNGLNGYAYSRDLDPGQPGGLQTDAPTTRGGAIPVYEPDGKTRIGDFNTSD